MKRYDDNDDDNWSCPEICASYFCFHLSAIFPHEFSWVYFPNYEQTSSWIETVIILTRQSKCITQCHKHGLCLSHEFHSWFLTHICMKVKTMWLFIARLVSTRCPVNYLSKQRFEAECQSNARVHSFEQYFCFCVHTVLYEWQGIIRTFIMCFFNNKQPLILKLTRFKSH